MSLKQSAAFFLTAALVLPSTMALPAPLASDASVTYQLSASFTFDGRHPFASGFSYKKDVIMRTRAPHRQGGEKAPCTESEAQPTDFATSEHWTSEPVTSSSAVSAESAATTSQASITVASVFGTQSDIPSTLTIHEKRQTTDAPPITTTTSSLVPDSPLTLCINRTAIGPLSTFSIPGCDSTTTTSTTTALI